MSKSLTTLGMGLAVFCAATFAGVAAPVTLNGHVPAAARHLSPKGNLSADTNLKLAIGLPLRNQDELDKLLQQIYDPASTNYHRYLNPDEFTERFGPTVEDYQKVANFASANGLTVTATHGNRVLLDVSGKVSDIEKAFHVKLHTYQHPKEARQFFAPDSDPSVDSSLPVLHVSGLDNYVVPRPLLHKMVAPASQPAAGTGPFGSYMGSDFRNAYVPGTSLDGSGQMVGLLQFDSGFYQSDITAYEIQAGLSTNIVVQPVLLDGYGGGPGFGNDEVSLDIEMVISMAPGISKVLVFEGDVTDDILNAMAASNQVKNLSASWGYFIDATSEQIFKQFAAQGQSFFNASGDSDAWVNGAFPPTDDPYITIVGGTTLTTATNNAWSSETVWNWGTEFGADGLGTGGGISTIYSIPSWQTNVSMVANHGSTTFRNLPDVALTADNVFVIFGGNQLGIFGGTSCASPLWAGYMALVNQQAVASSKPTIGFINPTIYALAEGPNYTNLFHDITTGNNTWSGSPTNFIAVPGYDLCTGWGTPNGTNLINALVGVATTHVSAPAPPYGTTLSALNGGNPNGTWSLFVQDDAALDAGVISNGWLLNLTTANPVGYAGDDEVLMAASTNTVAFSSNVTFYVTVTNYGPSTSSNVFVSDTLPSGFILVSSNATVGSVSRTGSSLTWNAGILPVGTGGQLSLTIQANSGGSMVNSANVNAGTPDPNPDDDSASFTVNVTGSAPPPVLNGSVVGSGGQFQFAIVSAGDQINIIEATTNLAVGPWIPVFTNVGSFTYTNAYLTNYPNVFFRDRIGP